MRDLSRIKPRISTRLTKKFAFACACPLHSSSRRGFHTRPVKFTPLPEAFFQTHLKYCASLLVTLVSERFEQSVAKDLGFALLVAFEGLCRCREFLEFFDQVAQVPPLQQSHGSQNQGLQTGSEGGICTIPATLIFEGDSHVQCHASRYDQAGLSDNGEPNMPVLKSLSFTALPKSGYDPILTRRDNFVAKLEEQKQLVKDPNHVRTVQRWTKVNGERQAITKQQAVRPWWKTDAFGQVVMSIKFGSKPVEFEKGKAGIAVGSKEKLPTVIDTLIAAVRAGELDDIFSQAAKTGAVGKPRKAA
jgi:hypothetical protein